MNVEVAVPIFHLAVFIVLVSICFLFNRPTLGLLIAFLFVFDWATFANRDLILEVLKENPYYWLVYVGGVALLACLAGLGVMATEREFRRPKALEERAVGMDFEHPDFDEKTGVLDLTDWSRKKRR